MRAPRLNNFWRRLRDRDQRGAALVEFAIAVPIFIALIAVVFDAGLGYNAARSSASGARSAARVGALAGDSRNADFRILDALRAQFGDGDAVREILVYHSDPSNPSGAPPASCTAASKCNRYTSTDLATLSQANFTTDPLDPTKCAAGAPDANWCPLSRKADNGDFLGVYVESTSQPTIGAISPDEFAIGDRAVFALYFPPEPATPTPTPPPAN